MSRINFPKIFAEQRVLLGLVKAKHDADGASSVLTTLLVQKNIDLNDDTTDGNTAAAHDANQKKFMRDAEEHVQQRNLKFEPVFLHTRAEIKFLKSFYAPNVRQLGDWGVTVDNKYRINYPPEFIFRAVLVKAIKQKHDSYAANTSPLTNYLSEHDIDLNEDAAATTEAETFHAKQLADRRNAEEATQLRDNLWQPVVAHLHDIADYLKKLYNNNEKKLGEWGIPVDDSPRKPKERISTVLPASQMTITGIVIGSTLSNIGTVALHLFKGHTTKGIPAIINPGEKLGMTKGYSNITVVNPSTLEKGKFQSVVG